MLFNSYIFILLFFPLCMVGYYGLNALKQYKLSFVFLLGMSLWFYGYFNPGYLLIIITSIILNFAVYKSFSRAKNDKTRKIFMIAGLIANIGILVYFKYTDFFISTANTAFGTDFTLLNVVLPLGISFFTFQQLSFVIDAYRGDTENYSFIEYACYVTYFPQLIAGPIVTHDELIPQFKDESKKKLNWDNFARGLFIFVLGLTKKVMIADMFGNAVNVGFADINSLNSSSAVLVMLAYTIQIYFDFSGYCDMAIGLGKMMNFDLPLNFNSPYKALTITEFWDRWHMTLTRFFTRYIYIPMGGSRKGKARTYFNVFIVFLISGFWHGAGFTFILWGILHGIFNIITRMFRNIFDKIPALINWIITFVFVNVTWVFFRADSIGSALSLLSRITALNFGAINPAIVSAFTMKELDFVLNIIPGGAAFAPHMMILFFIIAVIVVTKAPNAYECMNRFKPTVFNSFITLILFIWCLISFSGISTFLYFNF